MSIKERVIDAEALWRAGRKEGAWVLALVAAAATARKRYPRPMKDRESFMGFIRDITPILIYGKPSVGRQPQIVYGTLPLEQIIYEDMRCKLVHEGHIEDTVRLAESSVVDGNLTATFRVATPTSPHEFPDFWALHVLKAVREAPENKALFAGG